MKNKKQSLKLVIYRLKRLDELKQFIESKELQYSIVALIIINAITIGLETSKSLVNIFGT